MIIFFLRVYKALMRAQRSEDGSLPPIPSHITTFDSRYMSFSPPGSVYISPQVTGGITYTGGKYTPPANLRDPFQSKLPIDILESNISNPANNWYNKAIPPGGTSFNPGYMSQPPPGFAEANNIIPWDVRHNNFVREHGGITEEAWSQGLTSSPPPGSVYIGPEVTGGSAYTGSEYNTSNQGSNSGIYVPSPQMIREPNTSGIYVPSENYSPPARINP